MSRKSGTPKTFKCANCGTDRKMTSHQGSPPPDHEPEKVHRRHAASLTREISLTCTCGHYTIYTPFSSEG